VTFSDHWSDLVRHKAASWSSKLTYKVNRTMKDLNYQLSKLCRDNRDGGFSTQATRSRILDLIANQLLALGFRRMQATSLKPKHVDALLAKWGEQGIRTGTLKNRFSALRWWAKKVNKPSIIARDNSVYGIGKRQNVAKESKALKLGDRQLSGISDQYVLLTTIAKLMRPGGGRAVVAESLLLKHQLVILNRSRERAPNLRPMDRAVAGLCTLFVRPCRLLRVAVVLRPATLLAFHAALVKRKYRVLFSPKRRGKPGAKGPSSELIAAIVEIKRRNPSWGCRRIAQQLCLVFDLEIDKDVVRRVLAKHYRPDPGAYEPSWLSVLGHTKDSLWSIDLFRCESLILKSHWVLVVMDQCTRRIIGFGVHAGAVDGPSLCRMFNGAIRGAGSPKYISSDNDPLFRFHRWKANLRILDVTEVKTVPYLPISHPFVERLIGTIRREFLDFVPFWTARDLENKLLGLKEFYNDQRCHYALDGKRQVNHALFI
jgi:transposase InsO family protein